MERKVYQKKFFKIFGNIIKRRRLDSKYTIHECALKSHISEIMWINIEKGNITSKVTIDKIYNMAMVLKISMYDLFGEVQNIMNKNIKK